MNEMIVRGKIIASQLATMGAKASVYGYITLRKENGEQMKIKIDLHTECENLLVGDNVEIHAEELEHTGIIVARRVALISGPYHTSEESTSEAHA